MIIHLYHWYSLILCHTLSVSASTSINYPVIPFEDRIRPQFSSGLKCKTIKIAKHTYLLRCGNLSLKHVETVLLERHNLLQRYQSCFWLRVHKGPLQPAKCQRWTIRLLFTLDHRHPLHHAGKSAQLCCQAVGCTPQTLLDEAELHRTHVGWRHIGWQLEIQIQDLFLRHFSNSR